MNKSSRGLGRGLDALIPAAVMADGDQIVELPVAGIVPNQGQPRQVFDDEALNELAASIKLHGILQPIVVRRREGRYELVAGERRWRASQLAGLAVVPAVIRDYSDREMTEVALIENLQRQDLNVIEEAYAFRRLMDEFGLTQEEVAAKIGRSRPYIANVVRMINLPAAIREFVSRETLSMGQVRPLLAVNDQDLQLSLARQIISEGLTAREVEEMVRRLLGRSDSNPVNMAGQVATSKPSRNEYVVVAENQLRAIFGRAVKIKEGKVKSKIEIEFKSPAELTAIIEVLANTAAGDDDVSNYSA